MREHSVLKTGRCSGILLPVASLPAPAGIGNVGRAARTFVDFLVECGQRVWQILPLQIPDDAHSPYASPSAFASFPLLIDPEGLVDDGLLSSKEIRFSQTDASRIRYRMAEAQLTPLFRRAWASFQNGGGESSAEYRHFCRKERYWLTDFARHAALQKYCGGQRMPAYADSFRRKFCRAPIREEMRYQIFLQFILEKQLAALRDYRARRGILLCGDIPFYVAKNSADVWRYPEFFQLSLAAGVPPDDFCAAGQLWGSPIYRFSRMQADGFSWWIHRFARCAQLYDLTRLDHFRALDSFYAVPAHASDARHGQWLRGPGDRFLHAVQQALPSLSLIAEDLGVIPPSLRLLRERHGIPGMRVLHFAFGEGADNPFLPHLYERNTVVYLGTHDNDTTAGFWESAPDDVRRHAADYLGIRPDTETNTAVRHMMMSAASSVADVVIFTLQDLSCTKERINTPGASSGCWEYAAPAGWASREGIAFLQNITRLYGRWNAEGKHEP